MTQCAVSDPATDEDNVSVGRSVIAVAACVVAALVATASRYGYHQDELYFVAAGRHLDWGYADQGPLTPWIARAMTEIAPGSLTVLRLPSALAAGAVVVLTGLMARDLGGRRGAQLLAAGCAATSVIVLFDGHLLSTSTFDLLAWTVVTWLVVRIVRFGDSRLWPVAGLVLGVAMLNKPLPAFLGVALLVCVVVVGPRRLLRQRWLWIGVVVAVLLAAPFVLWQARHGWPQLQVSADIASGGSVSSQPWWAVIPFQALLAGPVLAPVWIVGLVCLFRDRELRFLAWTWVVLAAVFMATGGKPYYLAGLLPVLIAAGARPTLDWVSQRHARTAIGWVALGASVVVCSTIALPLLPVSQSGPVVAANPDVGETVGWPELARTVTHVANQAATRPVVFTSDYGEAGAVERFAPSLGTAYSGHNAFGYWGPPPDTGAPVVVVGYGEHWLASHMRGCRVLAHVGNDAGIDNSENGAPVALCAGPREAWSAEWPSLRHLG